MHSKLRQHITTIGSIEVEVHVRWLKVPRELSYHCKEACQAGILNTRLFLLYVDTFRISAAS